MTIRFFLPISTVKLIITGHKATGSNWLNLIVVNQCLHLFTRVYTSTTCSIKSYFNLNTNSESFRFICKHFLYVYYNMFKILLAIYSCLRSHSYTYKRAPRICSSQGWVDYKSFVVRYNYSYFKNM